MNSLGSSAQASIHLGNNAARPPGFTKSASGRLALVAAFTSARATVPLPPVGGRGEQALPPRLMPWEATTEALPRLHLLVVDPDPEVRGACAEIADGMGYVVAGTGEFEQAQGILRDQKVDLLLLDLKLPGPGSGAHAGAGPAQISGGLALLEEVKTRHPEISVVVMTAAGTVPNAVQVMRLGAEDYLTKPFALEELVTVLERESRRTRKNVKSRMLRDQLRSQQGSGPLIGTSPEMEKLYRILSKVAHSSHPVLILGESGTGKELVARQVHFNGPHSSKSFIPVDCGSVPPALLEGELFGYVKGSMPGRVGGAAAGAKAGILASADGGTVFLDDVGELPLELQAKLLRALQEKVVHPLGGSHPLPISARVLAATDADLAARVEQGRFRRDLYMRLNVVSLRMPALRQRKEDIPELVQFFLDRLQPAAGAPHVLSGAALEVLMAYDWPENVRELERAIEHACSLSTGSTLQVNELPTPLRELSAQIDLAASLDASGLNVSDAVARIQSIAEVEKHMILDTIKMLRGDKLLAAKLLGIGKTTLYRKLKEYGIQQWDERVESASS